MGNTALKINWNIDSLAAYVSDLVGKESGNVLGENQKSMVLSRLKKRLIDLGGMSPSEYYEHLASNYESEVGHLVSILTTHHTFFFREFCHFEFLLKDLPNIVKRVQSRGENKITILSSACSRGQEVYSLAMFFNYHLKNYPGMTFEILGTDIDPESVRVGANGVYQYSEIKSIPQIYLKDNWKRGTGDIKRFAKVKESLKKNCSFQVMNLFKPEEVLGNAKYDIIFCRNVFIYFEIKDVEKVVGNFKKFLNEGALFITGLSESLKSIDIEMQTYAPSVYCFDKPEVDVSESLPVNDVVAESVTMAGMATNIIPKPIRILAVDDSKSVLKLLARIFTSDPDFELVGTAGNGLEAQDFLKSNQVDAMTLDIHMPEMDGVEYLKKNFNDNHPHVVVISSASREDTHYAQETLKNGACDFVEKPALNNLQERAEEIKNKIKMAFLNSAVPSETLNIDEDFSKDFNIENSLNKARFYIASYSDIKKVKTSINELKGEQPPLFIFFEGNANFLDMIKGNFDKEHNVKVYDKNTNIELNHIYFCDFKSDFNDICSHFSPENISIGIFGIVSSSVEKELVSQDFGQILIEDQDSINKSIKEVVNDIFPWTSFSHVGTEYLAKLK